MLKSVRPIRAIPRRSLRLGQTISRIRPWGFALVALALLLSACQSGAEQSVQAGGITQVVEAAVSAAPTATIAGAMGVPPTPTAMSVLSATETPSPVPSPTATSTPTPFMCPHLQGRTESGVLVSSAIREQVRFLVHLPPCYDLYPERAFPVIYLFHGWPMDEWHWNTLGMDEWSDDWVSRGLVGPFISVMPGVNQDGLYVYSSGGSNSFEGFVIDELVPHIEGLYRTVQDPSGRAVGGISRGAVWALEIAMRNQDVFGIVGGHSPALALNRPLPQYDPYLLARQGVSGMRIYLDAGDGDWARAEAMRLRDLLIELEADVTYELHSGGHVDALWSGAIPDYITFYTATWPRSYDALPEWHAPSPDVGGGEAP
jgi:enterochelin esterase-like enzyme